MPEVSSVRLFSDFLDLLSFFACCLLLCLTTKTRNDWKMTANDTKQSATLTSWQGIPSPPSSPPLGKARRGGAAHTITVECERLFCETLRAVFLGEGMQRADSLVMGMHSKAETSHDHNQIYGEEDVGVNNDYGVKHEDQTNIHDYIEMWDYVGGIRFRGFVAENRDGEKVMFVFFDEEVINGDLKAGYANSFFFPLDDLLIFCQTASWLSSNSAKYPTSPATALSCVLTARRTSWQGTI